MNSVPPSDLDTEGAVLSAILLDASRLPAVREVLRPADFFAPANRRIYEAILALYDAGSPIDIKLVAGFLRDNGQLQQVGGSPYLAQLSDATPAIAHVVDHALRVRQVAAIGRIVEVAQRTAIEGTSGVGDVVAWATGAAREITRIAEDALLSKQRSPFEVVDADSIFAPLPPINYVIQALDLCPGAPAIWAGYGYSKKTLAAQSAALAIGAGLGKVWDCFAAPRGRVLHLDYEQGGRLTRERYQRLAVPMMIGPGDVGDGLSLVTMPKLHLDAPQAEDAIARLVHGYTLVIVDSLRAAAPSVEENSSDARRPLDMLTRVSERTGAAFVVIHHARKPSQQQSGGAKMSIRGSGALFDACGSSLVFEGEKGKPTRVSHEKARASGILTDDFELEVSDIPDGGNPRAGLLVAAQCAAPREAVDDAASKQRLAAKADRVRADLRELFGKHPELGGVDDIASRIHRRPIDVRGVLKAMITDGEVRAIGSTRDRRHQWAG